MFAASFVSGLAANKRHVPCRRLALPHAAPTDGVEFYHDVVSDGELGCTEVLAQMLDRRGARDQEHVG
jgi:hypothetical protein